MSWSRVAEALHLTGGEVWTRREDQLDGLIAELNGILTRAREIQNSPAHKHSSILLRPRLIEYLEALRESMQILRSICRKLHLEREGNPEYADYLDQELRADRVTYDEALSRVRRYGSALTHMLAKF